MKSEGEIFPDCYSLMLKVNRKINVRALIVEGVVFLIMTINNLLIAQNNNLKVWCIEN